MDRLLEIIDVLGRNKLRTFLTSLSVSWGIFMLVILLGAGSGMQNQIKKDFNDDAQNSVFIRPGTTSKPYRGLREGRRVVPTNDDYDWLKTHPNLEHTAGRFGRWRTSALVTRGAKTSSYNVRAVHPEHRFIELTQTKQGRFLNAQDISERRKVAVIGAPVGKFFFGTESPLGQWLRLDQTQFQVVGVFDDLGREQEREMIYVPVSTMQALNGGSRELHTLLYTLDEKNAADAKNIQAGIVRQLSQNHGFDPGDRTALRIRDNQKEANEVKKIFFAFDLFVWLVGAGTLMAGIVGVGNIMLIAVRERRREFGLRKAIGATPRHIVISVLIEAILLTTLSGMIGMIAGLGLVEYARSALQGSDYIYNPQVDPKVVLTAMALLIGCGTLAGYFPARQASRLSPVEALRDG